MSSFPLPLLLLSATLALAQTPGELPDYCMWGMAFNASKGKCEPCAPGSFEDTGLGLIHQCKRCPAGTYQPIEGSVSPSFCLPCPVDAISAPGAGKCDTCAKGTVGIGHRCRSCSPGHFLNGDGASEPCGEGTVARQWNMRKCLPCVGDEVVSPDRRLCVAADCGDAAEWVPQLRVCRRCPRGTYAHPKTHQCTPCPTANNTKVPLACTQCAPGSFVTNPRSSRAECESCGAGTTTKGRGKSVCKAPGSGCPGGTFGDLEGDCQSCPRNTRVNWPLGRCVPCTPNQWSTGGLVGSCTTCPGGQLRDTRKGRYPPCSCRVGTAFRNGRCQPCPRGSASTDSETCTPCGPDAAAPRQGSLRCRQCARGLTSWETNGTSCEPQPSCPRGFLAVSTTTVTHWSLGVCLRVSSGCPAGLENSGRNGRGATFCVYPSGILYCPPNSYYDGQQSCVSCVKGLRMVARSASRWCMPCKNGGTSAGGISETCVKCPTGHVVGAGACECPRNWRVVEDGSCVACTMPRSGVDRPVECEERTSFDV